MLLCEAKHLLQLRRDMISLHWPRCIALTGNVCISLIFIQSYFVSCVLWSMYIHLWQYYVECFHFEPRKLFCVWNPPRRSTMDCKSRSTGSLATIIWAFQVPRQGLVKSDDWSHLVKLCSVTHEFQGWLNTAHVTWAHVNHWQEHRTWVTWISSLTDSLHHAWPARSRLA